LKDIKYITIHGPATCYKAIIFRLGGHPLEREAGYTECRYVGMIILEPDLRRVIIDDEHGYPTWAIRKAGLDPSDPVLQLGWAAVLRNFDSIPDGGNVEVSRHEVKITDKWHF